MPTVFSHLAAPLALRFGLGRPAIPDRLLAAGLLASVVPDLDVLALRLGIPYADAFGHRGASHSLAFAMAAGLLALLLSRPLRASPAWSFSFVAASAASHGLLDMFTNGGHGVALWWPASDARLFFPWQVIEASPLSLQRVFGPRGLEVLRSELAWVWLPCGLVVLPILAGRIALGRAPRGRQAGTGPSP